MRIGEFLTPDCVIARLESREKPGVLRELCAPLARKLPSVPQEKFLTALVEREKVVSTGIGDGVAIPHGKLAGLSGLVASFGVAPEGVDFQALDKKPTFLFFALVSPEDSAGIHVKALARVSRLLRNPSFRQQIREAREAQAIYDLISNEDTKA